MRHCFIRNRLNLGRSICSHRLSDACEPIDVFDVERKCWYFKLLLCVRMLGRQNTIQINEIDKLMKECRSIWSEYNGSSSTYSHNRIAPMKINRTPSFLLQTVVIRPTRCAFLMMERSIRTLQHCCGYRCVVLVVLSF